MQDIRKCIWETCTPRSTALHALFLSALLPAHDMKTRVFSMRFRMFSLPSIQTAPHNHDHFKHGDQPLPHLTSRNSILSVTAGQQFVVLPPLKRQAGTTIALTKRQLVVPQLISQLCLNVSTEFLCYNFFNISLQFPQAFERIS